MLCQLEKHFVLHHPQPLPTGAQQSPGRRGERRQEPPPASQHHRESAHGDRRCLDTGGEGQSAGQREQRKKSHPSGCSEGGRRQQSPRSAAGWQTSLKQDPKQTRWVLQAAAYTPHRSTARAFREHRPPPAPVCVRI